MNNSFLAIENVSLEIEEQKDITPQLNQRESELIARIEAFNKVAGSLEWKLLQEKIFDGVVENLKKERDIEVEKKPLNGPKIHDLNGQLRWAKKYSNLLSLASIYKQELVNIRKQLNGSSI